MELKEPKNKKQLRYELKSSLPLAFGSKGELTKFHASLTALGSCVADPSEMEILYKMGYFGKGSLSKSHPSFGRIHYGAPPIIRERQWKCRKHWIGEVHKLSMENFFEDEKNEDMLKKDEKTTHNKTEFEKKDLDTTGDCKKFNNSIPFNTAIDSNFIAVVELASHEKHKNEIEILESDNTVQSSKENKLTTMDVDEVILDSTEEEDVCEIIIDKNQARLEKSPSLNKNEEIVFSHNKYRNDSELHGKVLVLSDIGSDTENYLTYIKPKIKHENFPIRETLHLTYEETFFLMFGLGCLRLIDFDGKYLNIDETWDYFCKENKPFIQKYVTYHYFRSKGWIVKSGLKYGGDFCKF